MIAIIDRGTLMKVLAGLHVGTHGCAEGGAPLDRDEEGRVRFHYVHHRGAGHLALGRGPARR